MWVGGLSYTGCQERRINSFAQWLQNHGDKFLKTDTYSNKEVSLNYEYVILMAFEIVFERVLKFYIFDLCHVYLSSYYLVWKLQRLITLLTHIGL